MSMEAVEYFNVTLTNVVPNALAVAGMPAKPTLAQIRQLQCEVAKLPQVELEPVHYFAEGAYGRELTIPAGVVVVGKLHRHQHLIMLIKGDVTVYTDAGMQRIKAPRVWVSEAGTKRAVFTHEDSTFVTVHVTNETDLDAIEEYVIEPEPDLALTSDEPQLSEFARELQGVYA